jgi:hypothetical protein
VTLAGSHEPSAMRHVPATLVDVAQPVTLTTSVRAKTLSLESTVCESPATNGANEVTVSACVEASHDATTGPPTAGSPKIVRTSGMNSSSTYMPAGAVGFASVNCQTVRPMTSAWL